MSKSFRKIPICGITTSDSEKWDKFFWHKRFRKKNKLVLKNSNLENNILMPHFREVSNIWLFSKDGKNYFGKYLNDLNILHNGYLKLLRK